MAIDVATVKKVASLSRLRESDERLAALAGELNGILGWIEQLNEVDVTGVEPMTTAIDMATPLRDDVENYNSYFNATGLIEIPHEGPTEVRWRVERLVANTSTTMASTIHTNAVDNPTMAKSLDGFFIVPKVVE